MATTSKYEAIPPLSTVKGLDPALEKVLRPMRNYINALIGGTGAQLPVKVELNADDIPSGFISERILGDASIITQKVVDDNITRVWTFESDGLVEMPLQPLVSDAICYTTSFIPSDKEFIVLPYLETFLGWWPAAGVDICGMTLFIVDALEIVRDTYFKWTQSTYDANAYYLTNEAGTASGLISKPDHIFQNAVAGGGPRMANITSYTAPMATGNWYWGDKETIPLGFSTAYLRLSDSSNPDVKKDGYVRAGYNLDHCHSPYIREEMTWDYGVIWQLTPTFFKTFTDTQKRSFVVVINYSELLGGLRADPWGEVSTSRLIVLERKK